MSHHTITTVPLNSAAQKEQESTKKPRKKNTSVRHTRAIGCARSKNSPGVPPDAEIQKYLDELTTPAVYAQVAAYQERGLRHRLLTLPVMVAFVLSLIWRQMGSVSEAVRVLNEEGVLWIEPLKVSQQAVAQRLRHIPASLFEAVLNEVLPVMWARQAQRVRPQSEAVKWAQTHFSTIVALDGSTLDALLRKVGLLREEDGVSPLGGRMAALLDVASRLPKRVWFEEDSQAHDQRFWAEAIKVIPPGALLLFDMGFINYGNFAALGKLDISFITRAKSNLRYQGQTLLQAGPACRDSLIWVGGATDRLQLRLVEVRYLGQWYRYLTNVLDPQVLPPVEVIALYWERWRVEDAFHLAKRLLGLAYLWVGASNGIQVQLWATWLLYAVMVDLTDSVAEVLGQPLSRVSLEMVFRGLYHYIQAKQRGAACNPVDYLAAKAKNLGIIKAKRQASPTQKLRLTLAQNA